MTAAATDGRARQMRRLVAQGRYAEAQHVFEDYCEALKHVLAGLPQGDPRVGGMEAEWRNLLDETRRQVLAGRAHAAVRLARISQSRNPYSQRPAAGYTWECLA
jgi:hypothetical protein